jgi:hypothetical protein
MYQQKTLIRHFKFSHIYQSLVGSVMINAGLDREDSGSIPATATTKGMKLLDTKIDSRIRLGGVDLILGLKKKLGTFYIN